MKLDLKKIKKPQGKKPSSIAPGFDKVAEMIAKSGKK